MSPEAIISVLLGIIGVLIVAWIGIASMWVKEKFADHGERIEKLEIASDQDRRDREEMLSILRNMRNVG